MYSVKAITSLTGLTAETLRAWERRYECITPKRSSNGRRSYSQQDLEKLKLLISLTRNGHPIGKIANLTCEQLRSFQNQTYETNDHQSSNLFREIIDALLNYRIDRCEQLLKRALLIYEPLEYATEIVLPILHKTGELWHNENINIAQEHMLSACMRRILLTLIDNMHRPSLSNLSILFATPCGEQHEFGILLACLIAASQHYTCYYLGTELPAFDLLDACRHLNPNIIVIGLVNSPAETQTIKELEKLISSPVTAKSDIWLAGAGAEKWFETHNSTADNCTLVRDILEFHQKTEQLHFCR